IAFSTGIEKPIAFWSTNVDCAAGAKIENADLSTGSARPVQMLEIKMSERPLRENVDHAENDSSQPPICVVENERNRRAQKSSNQRKHSAGENEKRDRDNNQIGEK